jgi:hypothetical protein
MGVPSVRYSQLTRALEAKLGLAFGTGKDRNAWYWLDGHKKLRVTLPKVKGGGGSVPKGTAKSIRNQLKLNPQQLQKLLSCPISGADYAEIIREKQAQGLL